MAQNWISHINGQELPDAVKIDYAVADVDDPASNFSIMGGWVAAGFWSTGPNPELSLVDRRCEGLISVTAGMTITASRGYFRLDGGTLIDCIVEPPPGELEAGLRVWAGGHLHRVKVIAPSYGKAVFLRGGHLVADDCDFGEEGEDAVYAIRGSASLRRCLLKPTATGIKPATGSQAHADCIQFAPHHNPQDGDKSPEFIYTYGCGFVLPDSLEQSQCVMIGVGSVDGLAGSSGIWHDHGSYFKGGLYAANTKAEVRSIVDLAVMNAPSFKYGSFRFRNDHPDGPVAVAPAISMFRIEDDGTEYLGREAGTWL